jgi:hypothetical protein
LENRLYIEGCVNQRQLTLAGGVGQKQAKRRHFHGQPLTQELVFAHRKPVACRQGLDMGGGVKKLHLPRIVLAKAPKNPKRLDVRQIKRV